MKFKIAIFATVLCASTLALAQSTRHLDVPAGDLAEALRALAQQAGVELIYQTEQVRGLKTKGVSGEFSAEDAVRQLIEGTALGVRKDASGAISISAPRQSAVEKTGGRLRVPQGVEVEQGVRLAQAEGTAVSDVTGTEQQAVFKQEREKEEGVQLEEIVVTGTHIRGVSSSSPMQVLTKQDIERAGFTTTEQVIKSIAANFGGGIGVETRASGVLTQHGGDNRGYASSANLRGLGSDSTLVLLNGHRLPLASQGFSADISTIPVTIIERIEVLKDGASAVYGSDAVAGVVNIITRQNFSGAQTTLVGGSVTSGNKIDYQANQLLGTDWSSGNAFFSYTYGHQASLSTASRSFSKSAPDGSTLTPSINAHSLYGSATQNVSDRWRFNAEMLWNRNHFDKRDSAFSGSTLVDTTNSTQVDALISTLSANYRFANAWQANVSGQFSTDRTENDAPGNTVVSAFHTRYRGSNTSFEPRIDGPVFSTPGGTSRLALGALYRSERFKQFDIVGLEVPWDLKRHIYAGYAEWFLPFFSKENRRAGAERLELTVSARYEHYDDFGSTTNPKFGLLWSPVEDIAFRATYSKSFRAPQLAELQQADAIDYLLDLPDPLSPSGSSLTIYRIGGSPDLTPQKAKSFNLGVSIDPSVAPGLHGELTYFNIRFRDRIQQPGDGAVFIELSPEIYGAFLTRNPPASLVDAIANGPAFANFYGPFTAADVGLIADARRTNISALNVDGLDLTGRYALQKRTGTLTFDVDASYFLTYDEVPVAGQSAVSRVNSPYYPASLRVRSGVNWSSGQWSFGGYFNYVNRYHDRRDPQNPLDIPAWPTLDGQVAYASAGTAPSAWSGTSVALTCINLLDRDPPRVANPLTLGTTSEGQNYDAANASPLGRYLSLRISKTW